MAIPILIYRRSAQKHTINRDIKTYVAPVPPSAALLRQTEQIECLAPLQRGLLVQFIQSQAAGPFHKEVDGLHLPSVPLGQRGREARRDAEDAEHEKYADGAVVAVQLLRQQLFRDEAELEVLAREDVDGVDDLRERREQGPLVRGLPGGRRAWAPGDAVRGSAATSLVGFAFGGLLGP